MIGYSLPNVLVSIFISLIFINSIQFKPLINVICWFACIQFKPQLHWLLIEFIWLKTFNPINEIKQINCQFRFNWIQQANIYFIHCLSWLHSAFINQINLIPIQQMKLMMHAICWMDLNWLVYWIDAELKKCKNYRTLTFLR